MAKRKFMRRKVFLLSVFAAFAILTIPAHGAEISRYQITFDIQLSGQVKESMHVAFLQETNESYFTYMFAGDISNLKINNTMQDIDYQIEKTGNEYRVRFLMPAGTREVYISFSSMDLVFRNSGIFQFFTNFQPPMGVEKAEITVILPQGMSVYRDMCFPENSQKTTDGQRISLFWAFQNPGDEIPVSVKFYFPYQSLEWLIIPIVAAFSAGTVSLFLWSRKKSQSSFLKGFTEDERKVVEVMKSRKSCYQNRLEKELGFSKAKMTRITQRLEKKGLIEREKTGRTKRIEWKS
jgi:uncharacterized membrane protein